MAELVKPSEKYKGSFIEAIKDFQSEGRDMDFDVEDLNKNFEKLVVRYENNERGIDLRDGYVPDTTLWLVEGDEFIGKVSIRHKLTEKLSREGGHIGYQIRPTKRNMGYGTEILKQALPVAYELGISKVLVTCDDNNIGSAKIIEKNGGVLENKMQCGKDLKRRYWIDNGKD